MWNCLLNVELFTECGTAHFLVEHLQHIFVLTEDDAPVVKYVWQVI